jgi:hypothetical protein
MPSNSAELAIQRFRFPFLPGSAEVNKQHRWMMLDGWGLNLLFFFCMVLTTTFAYIKPMMNNQCDTPTRILLFGDYLLII